MENELLIRFGGDSHIRIETLTEFLEKYRFLLYKINNGLGYSDSDLIVEVYPPEEGSFKIKLSPKYENLMLGVLGGFVASTLAGLVILWVSSPNENKISISDVERIIKCVNQNNDKEIVVQVYNNYQLTEVKQTLNQTFEVVSKDNTISSLDVSLDNKEIVNIPKSDFHKYIKAEDELSDEVIKNEKIDIVEASIIIKTVHFEGKAKWTFIWNGYQIKASVKDQEFLDGMNSEPFKKGDLLKVKLQKRSIFNEDLNTYIVDEKSYEIIEVINHSSTQENKMTSMNLED